MLADGDEPALLPSGDGRLGHTNGVSETLLRPEPLDDEIGLRHAANLSPFPILSIMIRRLPPQALSPHNFVMGWGSRIALARDEAGLNQTELGQAVGAAQSTVSEWEREKNEPDFATIIRIARATNVNPCWLAFGDEFPDPIAKLLKVYDSMGVKDKEWLQSTVDRELERLGVQVPPQE